MDVPRDPSLEILVHQTVGYATILEQWLWVGDTLL